MRFLKKPCAMCDVLHDYDALTDDLCPDCMVKHHAMVRNTTYTINAVTLLVCVVVFSFVAYAAGYMVEVMQQYFDCWALQGEMQRAANGALFCELM